MQETLRRLFLAIVVFAFGAVANGETKDLVLDFTESQSFPEGWTAGSDVGFREIDGINCLYVNTTNGTAESQSIYTGVFYKIKKVSILVHRFYGKNSSFNISFFLPSGENATGGFRYVNPDTSISEREVVFEDGDEYSFPEGETDYGMCILGDGVAVRRMVITYEERPAELDNVTSFIFKNYYGGGDDVDISGAEISSGGIKVLFPDGVTYNSILHYAELNGGSIKIEASDMITRIEVGTSFLGKDVVVNGESLTPQKGTDLWISSWNGLANSVEISAPDGGTAAIVAIAVYTQNISVVEGNLSQIIKYGETGRLYRIDIPLQGAAVVADNMLYARTVTDDACSDISTNEGEVGENDDDAADFVQRDWVALEFDPQQLDCEIENYVGRCMSAGIVGTFDGDAVTPTLKVSGQPTIDENAVVEERYNTYLIRNFYGDSQTGAFVVKPQINEYAYVRGNITNSGSDYCLSDENGSLRLDNSCEIVDETHLDHSVKLEGVVLVDSSGSDYLFYVLGLEDLTPSEMDAPEAVVVQVYGRSGAVVIDGACAGVAVYDISGRLVADVAGGVNTSQLEICVPNGCYLVKTNMPNGEYAVQKVIVR